MFVRGSAEVDLDLPEPYCSSDYYFFRQRFMRSNPGNEVDMSGQLLPELKPICVC